MGIQRHKGIWEKDMKMLKYRRIRIYGGKVNYLTLIKINCSK